MKQLNCLEDIIFYKKQPIIYGNIPLKLISSFVSLINVVEFT